MPYTFRLVMFDVGRLASNDGHNDFILSTTIEIRFVLLLLLLLLLLRNEIMHPEQDQT